MVIMQRVVKPSTQKGRRAIEAKAPKVVENNKTTMVLKGNKTCEVINAALTDFYLMKKPDAVLFSKKHDIRPFEDEMPLERLSTKTDSSLFMFGSHSKKRPNNIVIGRMYDTQLLDMFELGADSYKAMAIFKNSKPALGNKPCLIFNGSEWDTAPTYQRLKNLFIDFFRGPTVEKVRLMGLESALTFTLSEDGIIFLRNYGIKLKKSGQKNPRVELEEIGPSCNLAIRRHKLASDTLYKESLKRPRTVKPKKKKNISHDTFGSQLGRVHMQKQDLNKLNLRRMKGLKKGKKTQMVGQQKTTICKTNKEQSSSK